MRERWIPGHSSGGEWPGNEARRLLSLSATYIQESGMAAAGEWRDEVGCSKLLTQTQAYRLNVPSVNSAHIFT